MTKDVLELNRKDVIWVCSECKKEYRDIPAQCTCGAMARTFDEKEVVSNLSEEREEFVVERNIIYDGKQINKGKVVSLVRKDRYTKELLKNKLITSVKKEVEGVRIEKVKEKEK